MQKIICCNPYPCARKCQESCCVLQYIDNILFCPLPQSTFITVPSDYLLIPTCLPVMTDIDLFDQLTYICSFSQFMMLKINVTCELFPVSLV